ncbi:hypothetical protein Golomagni_03210 [Golovinomyces magnicellulatus]|nr:hypothetical protein Golomagni_03210 [Golovinomyces magnicellulatus]
MAYTGRFDDYLNTFQPDGRQLSKTIDKDYQLDGGFDATPIPFAREGYTIKFTFHKAKNLPRSDLSSKLSDPYLTATLTSDLPKRHKSDPDMMLRTPTIHNCLNPKWNTEWIVAGIPSTGFKLKCRIYDEDQTDHDDRLGNVTLKIDRIESGWRGKKHEPFIIKKRTGSKRAYLLHGCTAMLDPDVRLDGSLFLSVELLGISEKPHGRMYTVGVTSFFKHYSPLIGLLAGTKAPNTSEEYGQHHVERYDFQANQFQLQGPVPAELYHRFFEFKPFVKEMFDGSGIRGRLLNKALHHQHATIYKYSSSTEYGIVSPCSNEASMQFLKMVHFGDGWRTFTYILTLDGLLRFTETGKDFGIDLLSKHAMHSDVSVYVAFSGEFIVRRRHNHNQSSYQDTDLSHAQNNEEPSNFELIIDNESGTYRPKGDLLPLLRKFLKKNFPGLCVETKDCLDEAHASFKQDQREYKKKERRHVQSALLTDSDISHSDEEILTKCLAGKKGKRERIYATLEDPRKAIKDLLDGE